jgi:hypothetical protein
VTRGTDHASTSDNNSHAKVHRDVQQQQEAAVTEMAPDNLEVMLRGVSRCRLTQEQVFRLWKCAVKDDDKLVNMVLEQLYNEMIAFNPKRAERTILLIIDRDETADAAFQDLLRDITISRGSKPNDSRPGPSNPTWQRDAERQRDAAPS